MKRTKIFIAIILIASLAGGALGQDTLYVEEFTDGSLQLDWFTPWDPGNNMTVDYWEGNPSGDCWVGFVSNELSGGGVGSALAGESNLTDYEIKANVYCTLNSGSYQGLVARWDTNGGNWYYSFRTDFDSDQRLVLVKNVGGMPPTVTIAQWVGPEIPGGYPTQDDWHNMALKCEGDQFWVYWDGQELSGCPYTDDFLSAGFFGIYVFNMVGVDSTHCDDIFVLGEAGPQPFDLVAGYNHFLDVNMQEMILRPAEGEDIYFMLDWDVLNGTGTSNPFRITLELDEDLIFMENNPGVEPNTSHETISTIWTAELGEHTYRWTLDPGDAVIEGNEDNNIREGSFLVLPTTAFDFQADSAWVANIDTVKYEEPPEEGDEILFALFWSAPMGEGFSEPFNITLSLDGEDYFLITMMGAAAGEDYMTVADSVWTATLGFHYYTWEVDADDWVNEFNENNNSFFDGFDVVEQTSVPWRDDYTGFLPNESRLSGVFPNPFNPSVTLSYQIAQPGKAKLVIYDVAGREVAKLLDGYVSTGFSRVTWDADGLASGAYFALLDVEGRRSVQRMLLVK